MLASTGPGWRRRKIAARHSDSTFASTTCPSLVRNGYCRDYDLETRVREKLTREKEKSVLNEAYALAAEGNNIPVGLVKSIHEQASIQQGQEEVINKITAKISRKATESGEVLNLPTHDVLLGIPEQVETIIGDLKKEKKYTDWDLELEVIAKLGTSRRCRHAHHSEISRAVGGGKRATDSTGNINNVITSSSVLLTRTLEFLLVNGWPRPTSSSSPDSSDDVMTLTCTKKDLNIIQGNKPTMATGDDDDDDNLEEEDVGTIVYKVPQPIRIVSHTSKVRQVLVKCSRKGTDNMIAEVSQGEGGRATNEEVTKEGRSHTSATATADKLSVDAAATTKSALLTIYEVVVHLNMAHFPALVAHFAPTVYNESCSGAVNEKERRSSSHPVVSSKAVTFSDLYFVQNFFLLVDRMVKEHFLSELVRQYKSSGVDSRLPEEKDQRVVIRVHYEYIALPHCNITCADGIISCLQKAKRHTKYLKALDLSYNKLESLRFLFQIRAHFAPKQRIQHQKSKLLEEGKDDTEGTPSSASFTGGGRLSLLWLHHNPITLKPDYREQIRTTLPTLLSLDGQRIRKPPLGLPFPIPSQWNQLESLTDEAKLRRFELWHRAGIEGFESVKKTDDEEDIKSREEIAEEERVKAAWEAYSVKHPDVAREHRALKDKMLEITGSKEKIGTRDTSCSKSLITDKETKKTYAISPQGAAVQTPKDPTACMLTEKEYSNVIDFVHRFLFYLEKKYVPLDVEKEVCILDIPGGKDAVDKLVYKLLESGRRTQCLSMQRAVEKTRKVAGNLEAKSLADTMLLSSMIHNSSSHSRGIGSGMTSDHCSNGLSVRITTECQPCKASNDTDSRILHTNSTESSDKSRLLSMSEVIDIDEETFGTKFLHPSCAFSVTIMPGCCWFDEKRMFSKSDVENDGKLLERVTGATKELINDTGDEDCGDENSIVGKDGVLIENSRDVIRLPSFSSSKNEALGAKEEILAAEKASMAKDRKALLSQTGYGLKGATAALFSSTSRKGAVMATVASDSGRRGVAHLKNNGNKKKSGSSIIRSNIYDDSDEEDDEVATDDNFQFLKPDYASKSAEAADLLIRNRDLLLLSPLDIKELRVLHVSLLNIYSRSLLQASSKDVIHRIARGPRDCFLQYKFTVYPSRFTVQHHLHHSPSVSIHGIPDYFNGVEFAVQRMSISEKSSCNIPSEEEVLSELKRKDPILNKPGISKEGKKVRERILLEKAKSNVAAAIAAAPTCKPSKEKERDLFYVVTFHGIMSWSSPSMTQGQSVSCYCDRTLTVLTKRMPVKPIEEPESSLFGEDIMKSSLVKLGPLAVSGQGGVMMAIQKKKKRKSAYIYEYMEEYFRKFEMAKGEVTKEIEDDTVDIPTFTKPLDEKEKEDERLLATLPPLVLTLLKHRIEQSPEAFIRSPSLMPGGNIRDRCGGIVNSSDDNNPLYHFSSVDDVLNALKGFKFAETKRLRMISVRESLDEEEAIRQKAEEDERKKGVAAQRKKMMIALMEEEEREAAKRMGKKALKRAREAQERRKKAREDEDDFDGELPDAAPKRGATRQEHNDRLKRAKEAKLPSASDSEEIEVCDEGTVPSDQRTDLTQQGRKRPQKVEKTDVQSKKVPRVDKKNNVTKSTNGDAPSSVSKEKAKVFESRKSAKSIDEKHNNKPGFMGPSEKPDPFYVQKFFIYNDMLVLRPISTGTSAIGSDVLLSAPALGASPVYNHMTNTMVDKLEIEHAFGVGELEEMSAATEGLPQENSHGVQSTFIADPLGTARSGLRGSTEHNRSLIQQVLERSESERAVHNILREIFAIPSSTDTDVANCVRDNGNNTDDVGVGEKEGYQQ